MQASGQTHWVASGSDRFDERRGMGISTLAFKTASQDSDGRIFIIEQTMHAPGGPPRHLHYAQEEWFYALEGDFIVEVADQRFRLAPGDSLLAPRQVPHTWAYVGTGIGRLLVVFVPAGQMEDFFRETTKANAMPAQHPQLWHAHGMQVVGPPLALDVS